MYKPMTMKVKLYSSLFLLTALILFSCRSAKKMYEKGNYDEAVELAAKKAAEETQRLRNNRCTPERIPFRSGGS